MASEFLISFHRQHFGDTDIPIYSKEVFYKLLEELNKNQTPSKGNQQENRYESRDNTALSV